MFIHQKRGGGRYHTCHTEYFVCIQVEVPSWSKTLKDIIGEVKVSRLVAAPSYSFTYIESMHCSTLDDKSCQICVSIRVCVWRGGGEAWGNVCT